MTHPLPRPAAPAHELVRGGELDLAAWGGFLARAARRAHPGAEAICPFGFELAADRSFLARDLTRFYVVLRLPPEAAEREATTALDFLRHLRRDLELGAPRFTRTVGVWRCNRVSLELGAGAGSEPLRMINVLSRVTPESALADYAGYLVAAARGILDGAVGEAAAFERSTRARRRLFQLVEMIGKACELALGSAPVGSFPCYEIYCRELVGFAGGRENQPIEEVERELLRDWALPALRRLATLMESPDSPSDTVRRVEAVDQYSGAALSCSVSAAKVLRLRAVIEKTYRELHAPAAAAADDG